MTPPDPLGALLPAPVATPPGGAHAPDTGDAEGAAAFLTLVQQLMHKSPRAQQGPVGSDTPTGPATDGPDSADVAEPTEQDDPEGEPAPVGCGVPLPILQALTAAAAGVTPGTTTGTTTGTTSGTTSGTEATAARRPAPASGADDAGTSGTSAFPGPEPHEGPVAPAAPAAPAAPGTPSALADPGAAPSTASTNASQTTSQTAATTAPGSGAGAVAGTATVVPLAAPAGVTDAPGPAAAVTRQVFPEVIRMAGSGTGPKRVTLRLQPEFLGEVRVVLSTRRGELHVTLAASGDARRALQTGTPELRRLLEAVGSPDARVLVRDLPTGHGDAASSRPDAPPPTDRPGRLDLTGGAPDSGTRNTGSDTSGDTPGEARRPTRSTATDGTPDATDPSRHTETVTRARAAGLDVTM